MSCGQVPPDGTGNDWPALNGTWTEVFKEDFNGPASSAPSGATWNVNVNGRPDNQEKEYYTDRPTNVSLDGNGNLVITAQSEHYAYAAGVTSGQPYTSGRLDTRGHQQPQYGRIEARIKLPSGKGLWPAFWMLGQNIDTVHWPNCGEIDILEMAGSTPNTISGSAHGPGYSGNNAFTKKFTLGSGNFSDDYHVFAFEWTADAMRWLVDEQEFHVRTKAAVEAGGATWVFNQPMFIILNLAVGGFFDGDPDANTKFPAQMLVDYVKISTLTPN